jgi:hypothetical protein
MSLTACSTYPGLGPNLHLKDPDEAQFEVKRFTLRGCCREVTVDGESYNLSGVLPLMKEVSADGYAKAARGNFMMNASGALVTFGFGALAFRHPVTSSAFLLSALGSYFWGRHVTAQGLQIYNEDLKRRLSPEALYPPAAQLDFSVPF